PFAHPSEQEFARLLDFYCIKWRYEPRSFPLQWNDDGEVCQAFTPDFYLPQLDTYVELTTMRQAHISSKHRKLRRMAELHPEVSVRLLYRRDIAHLQAAAESMAAEIGGIGGAAHRVVVDQPSLAARVGELAQQISTDYTGRALVLVGVLKGCTTFLADLARELTCPVAIDYVSLVRFSADNERQATVRFVRDVDVGLRGRHVLVIKDVVNTGLSLDYLIKRLRASRPASLGICALAVKEGKQICRLPLRYTGFSLPNDYLVGYGLDYREQYRNLPYIAAIDVPNGTNPD
ncbi:MAG: hypoxanthine phosphoribosyltransferase, partial [Chloroflexota bacterium]|nr:hypoxanthine phosphoribosyltransferase [Chloroflexota bacterium]